MEQLNIKTPLIFRIGITLFCVVLCSFHLTGGLYARYTSNADATATARVANFSVSTIKIAETEKTLDLTVASEKQSVSCAFSVTNYSEVTALETVTIVLPQACPVGLELSMALNGDAVALTTEDTITYTCTADFDFQGTHEWVLTFTGDPDTAKEANLADIDVSVKVEQKD